MNREIKFRGQQINTKKWVYGYLYRNKGLYVICENIRYAEEEPILLDTVGQYTGLHDKNGREIFEGDIVKLDSNMLKITGIVTYHNNEAIFVLEDLHDEIEECLWYMQEDLEVIGNIYDNPELLEGE
jgi:uncharacterized phage protein (TIGR01671 family)